MSLSSTTLRDELIVYGPNGSTYAEAAQNWASAYGEYMKDAASNGVPTVAAFIDGTLVPAMKTSLEASFTTSTTAATAATAVKAALAVFWAATVPAPASFIVGATVITPPTFAALEASLQAVFAVPSSDLDAQMTSIASSIHTATLITPTATFVTPTFAIT